MPDDSSNVTFYVTENGNNVVAADEVTEVFSRLEPSELSGYIGASVSQLLLLLHIC